MKTMVDIHSMDILISELQVSVLDQAIVQYLLHGLDVSLLDQ